MGVTVRGEAGRLAGWVACRRGCPWSQSGPSPPDLEGPEASHSSYTSPQKMIRSLSGEPQPFEVLGDLQFTSSPTSLTHTGQSLPRKPLILVKG